MKSELSVRERVGEGAAFVFVLLLLLVAFLAITAVFVFPVGVVLGLLLGSSFSEAAVETWGFMKILGLVYIAVAVLGIPFWSAWYGLKWAWKYATGEEGEEAERRLINFLIAAGFSVGGVAFVVWLAWGLIR